MVEKIIDIEPKWSQLINKFYDWIESGTEEQVKLAKEEINKLVVIGDLIRNTQKENKVLVITKSKSIEFDSIEELKEKINEVE